MPGEEWPKNCDGSGEYRRVLLFDFVFLVDGRRYRWHQPAAQVRWPVQVSAEDWPAAEFHRREVDPEPLSDEVRWLYILTVREYLAGHGIRVAVLGVVTWRDVWQSWTGWVWLERVRFRLTRWCQRWSNLKEDEIPF